MKLGNKGFSLVELIVVMAIMVIVGGAIAGFLSTSTSSYRTVSNEVDLQEEAQLTMNQLETLILNAEAGVNYKYSGTMSDSSTIEDLIYNDSQISGDVVQIDSKTLYIYNADCRYIVSWDNVSHTLNYERQELVSGGSTISFTPGTQALLANYVQDFKVNLDTSKSNTVVKIGMTLGKTPTDTKTYTANQNFSLRNQLVLNTENTATIYDDIEPAGVTPVAERVTGSLNGTSFSSTDATRAAYDIFVSKANPTDYSIPFSYMVRGTGMPSQECNFTLTGNASTDTRVESGIVIISKNEEAEKVTFTVSSKMDESVQASVEINVSRITGITTTATKSSYAPNSTALLYTSKILNPSTADGIFATVSGVGNYDTKYRWTAVSNCTVSDNADGTQKVTITGEAGSTFKLKATSTADSTYQEEYEGTISVLHTEVVLKREDGSSFLRGKKEIIRAYDPDNEYNANELIWTVEIAPIYNTFWGERVGTYSNLSSDYYGVDGNNHFYILIPAQYDFFNKYSIRVSASYNGSIVSDPIIITLDRVKIVTGSSLSSLGEYPDTVSFDDKKDKTIYYKLSGIEIPYTDLSIKWDDDSSSVNKYVSIIDGAFIFKESIMDDSDIDEDTYIGSIYANIGGTKIELAEDRIELNVRKIETGSAKIKIKGKKYSIETKDTNGWKYKNDDEWRYKVYLRDGYWRLETEERKKNGNYDNHKEYYFDSGKWNQTN